MFARTFSDNFATMSFTELKRTIRQLSPKQRREVFELLADVARGDGKDWAAELDRRHARMAAGVKYTRADLQRRHLELIAKGR